MPMNTTYKAPDELPDVIPVFPLPGALLLPRGQMPLNIFEPRYLAMVDDALRSPSRMIGMMAVTTPYRQCQVTYQPFADDFIARKGEDDVDRKSLLHALTAFLTANNLKADWEGIENAPNEALVNALAMMSPYDVAEKQAMLEAPNLKTRAEILIAVTEIELAKAKTPGETPLQ